MLNWIDDHFMHMIIGLIVLMITLLMLAGIHDENVRKSMIGKSKDYIIQEWGPPTNITSIKDAEVDTWAQYHAESITYVSQSMGNGTTITNPIVSPAYTERTIVTFKNGIAVKVEHP